MKQMKNCGTCIFGGGIDVNNTMPRVPCRLRSPVPMQIVLNGTQQGSYQDYASVLYTHDYYGRPWMDRTDFCGDWKKTF